MLLEMAARADETCQRLSQAHAAGTVHDERNEACELRERALAGAKWMQEQDIEQLLHVGTFHAFLPVKGQRVRVRQGAVVRSWGPGGPDMVAQRARVVTVHRSDPGFIDVDGLHRQRGAVRQGEVVWSGAQGWCSTDLNNVELIEEAVEPAAA